ncbi:MAG: acyltransferase family protein [Tannerella sp.]|jgi:hypothetical protein|nr:acyltransferase family protein [Tannerella sp.]
MRRYDIDSLRVLVFCLLIFYHVGMFFVPWGFHLKNNVTYEWLTLPMLFLNQWRLPLLFLISGIGTRYALSKRSARQFLSERFFRLFIPLVFGMLFIIPPQIYVERLANGQFSGNYLDYWTSQAFAGGAYPEGNVSWHHLWFLNYLFNFSLLLTPVFVYLRNHPDARIIRWFTAVAARPFGLFVVVVPLWLCEALFYPDYSDNGALIGDWYGVSRYFILFFVGFMLICTKDVFWTTVTDNRRKYLYCGIAAFCLWLTPEIFGVHIPYLADVLKAVNSWSWCLTMFGYAAAHLNRESKTLKYANEAVYPFYILHQTVMLILCYFIRNLDWQLFPKFSVLAIGTFGISWLIYEFGIRRYRLIRPLFGMKKVAQQT